MGDTVERTRRVAPWTAVWALAALVGLAALVNAAPWIAAPPGDSHEGRNAAVWGLAARALRDHPIESRLGGRRPDGKAYADHPPVIVLAAALTTVPGEGGIALRVPSIVASLAAIALMLALLRRLGYSPLAAGIGVVLMGTSAMFLKQFAEGYPWAHLDIAGMAFEERPGTPRRPAHLAKGGTGFGVRLLVEFLRSWATSA